MVGKMVHARRPPCCLGSGQAWEGHTASLNPSSIQLLQNKVVDVLHSMGVHNYTEEYSPRGKFFSIDIASALSA